MEVTPPAIEASDLYRFFHSGDEEVLALRGVSMRVDPGEVVAVVGPSGSGKSTLLACLAGLDEPDGGTVRVAGERLSHRPEAERAKLRAARVGVLFQRDNLIEHLTVEGNVRLARQLARRPRVTDDDLLESLGIAHRSTAYPSQLSGGEAVRAGLATALANDPAILVADEPTGEVDVETEDRILGLLRARAEAGTATVVATHSRRVASVADRVITLADGRVVE